MEVLQQIKSLGVQSSQDQPHVHRFPMTQKDSAFGCITVTQSGYSWMIKEKDTGRVWRNPCASLHSCLPMKGHILPPAKKMQQHVYNVPAQESPLETQHPGFYRG